MTDLFQVGLSSWIVDDGNYKTFSIGDVRSFALEYFNEEDLQSTTTPCSHRHIGNARHIVSGKRVHLGGLQTNLTSTWVVIDIGVLAYRELYSYPPPPDSFSGELYIGVDPFFYFENLANQADAPPLIYDWRIHRIEVETAPRILQDGILIYDPDKRKRADVQDTNYGDDFVLHCERLASAPTKRLTYR